MARYDKLTPEQVKAARYKTRAMKALHKWYKTLDPIKLHLAERTEADKLAHSRWI